MKLARRDFMRLSASAAATALYSGHANAASPVVVSTWGGDIERSLREAVVPIASKKYGTEVVLDIGTPSARRTKLTAQANRPRNAIDAAWLADGDAYLLGQQGLFKKVGADNIPNYNLIQPTFRTKDYSVPTYYAAIVLLHNAKQIAKPVSICDLWRKEYAGRVGLSDLSYDKLVPMISTAFGGSPKDYQPGYDALLELKKQGVRVYPSNEAVGNAFQSGEIVIALMWKGRAYQWAKAGLPIASVTPKEGAFPAFFEMVITNNATSAEAAANFIGCMLEPEAQRDFAVRFGGVPATNNADLSSDLLADVAFSRPEIEQFIVNDLAYAQNQSASLLEWWNQKLKG